MGYLLICYVVITTLPVSVLFFLRARHLEKKNRRVLMAMWKLTSRR